MTRGGDCEVPKAAGRAKGEKTMVQKEHICADLYEELLCLLPTNNLLNFKRVCKYWNQLISSQRFIQKHLHRSNRTLIITLSPLGIFVCDDPTGKKIRRSIAYPEGFSFHNTIIAGSCDGLVCLVRAENKDFAIINPSTGTSDVRIAYGFDFHRRYSFWFGRHPSTGEYLIITIVLLSYRTHVHVYELSSKLTFLKHFSAFAIPPKVYCFDPIPILLHGALHWAGYRATNNNVVVVVIFAYDIQKNKLLENFPPFMMPRDIRLGIIDECLFAIIQTWEQRSELWIMKEYGVEESWSKYCNIEGFEECEDLSPLGFLSDGDLILNVGNEKIVKYSFSDKKGTVVPDIEARSAVLCDVSLVSPSLIWGSNS